MVRWFLVRPLRVWWTTGWLGRLVSRWLGQAEPVAPERPPGQIQQR